MEIFLAFFKKTYCVQILYLKRKKQLHANQLFVDIRPNIAKYGCKYIWDMGVSLQSMRTIERKIFKIKEYK